MSRRIIGLSIIGLISLLGIVLSALLGYLPNLHPDLFKERAWLFWSIVGGIVLLLTGYGMAQWVQAQPAPHKNLIDSEQAHRNRRVMLEKVWHTWIEGVLHDSLYQETLITLGMQSHPQAVRPPRNAVIQQADQLLPPDTPILQVFDDSAGALLILGAPGAGKTTLLLELARDLIERAGRETAHLIPVIFPLSTWAVRRLSLAEWLADELVKRYRVASTLAQAWVASDTILPLLDGLDEVTPTVRDACVNAINAFRSTRGSLPIVVCSRITDYDELAVKLRLHNAIVVQPLSREQVRLYVREIGFPFIPSSTSPLWNLLTTPLMLNIATLAYVGRPADALRAPDSWADTHEHLIAAYIERRLSQMAPDTRYSAAQTNQYLSWLAWQMQQHNQTVFYIERMQPNWLPLRQRWIPTVGVGLAVALAVGLSIGILNEWIFGLIFGLVIGIFSGYKNEIATVEVVRWSWSKVRPLGRAMSIRGIVTGVIFGLLGGLALGLVGGLGVGLFSGLVFALTSGPAIGLAFGLGAGLLHGEIETKTVPNQGIQHSARNALMIGPVIGLFFGAGIGLAVGAAFGLRVGISVGLLIGFIVGVNVGLDKGGRAILQHMALRCLLAHNGSIPWRYVGFLDFAAERILLRKVGGGYIFIHRLLLDYFANQYTGPETAELSATSKDM